MQVDPILGYLLTLLLLLLLLLSLTGVMSAVTHCYLCLLSLLSADTQHTTSTMTCLLKLRAWLYRWLLVVCLTQYDTAVQSCKSAAAAT